MQVRDLRKDFGDRTAVKGVSFDVNEGEVFGLLGPNGAGKSTMISMICGLLKPTGGDVLVGGRSVTREPMAVKAMLGVIPQDVALYPTLSARENLHFWGKMYGLRGAESRRRTEEVLGMVGLSDRGNDRIQTYSGGMKRRINIAAGLLHSPKFLIMDEPTVGIDPQSRNHILETVQQLNRQGLTVLYTSHYMEEVEMLCHRIAIVDDGRIVAVGTKEELKKLVGNQDLIKVRIAPDKTRTHNGSRPEAVYRLQKLRGVSKVTPEDGYIDILAENGREILAEVCASVSSLGIRIHSVEVQEPDLESVFLHLTGKALRD